MATKKRGLGQGIDSLIPNKVNANKETETVKVNAGSEKNETDGIFVNINKVEPNREQPRKNFDEDSLVDLSESIKQVGVLQPLLVLDKKDYYEIIAGERRWRAAKLAGLKEVPVRIMNLTDQEVVEISLVENIQRENLNPIEEAFAYKRLLTEFHLKQDEVEMCIRDRSFKKLEKKKIPENFNYDDVPSLRIEARQKLKTYSPTSIGQASRISGVSPADVSVLLVYMEQMKYHEKESAE